MGRPTAGFSVHISRALVARFCVGGSPGVPRLAPVPRVGAVHKQVITEKGFEVSDACVYVCVWGGDNVWVMCMVYG